MKRTRYAVISQIHIIDDEGERWQMDVRTARTYGQAQEHARAMRREGYGMIVIEGDATNPDDARYRVTLGVWICPNGKPDEPVIFTKVS